MIDLPRSVGAMRRLLITFFLAVGVVVVIAALAAVYLGPVVFGQVADPMPGLVLDQWLPLIGK